MALDASADAQESIEGKSCVTTADCGSLRCIEGTCRHVEALAHPRPHRHSSMLTQAFVGDGRGYVAAVLIADIAAFASTLPVWMPAYAADASRFAVGLQVLPLTQLIVGPIIHAVHGRSMPTLISLLGWTTVAMTTFFTPLLVTYGNEDRPEGLALGSAFCIGGSIVMTVVDAFLARDVHVESRRPHAVPSLALQPGGLVAGIGGVW
jgi:hypothetical protein